MKKSNKGKLIILAILASSFVIILGLGIYGYFTVLKTDFIYEGVKVDEFDLSYKTREEALNFIKTIKEEELDEKNMVLSYGDKEYSINLRELGFYYDYNQAVDEAYSIGREGNIIVRIKNILETKKIGAKIPLNSSYNVNNIVDIDL